MKSLSKLDRVNLLLSVYVLIELYVSTLVSYSELQSYGWTGQILSFAYYFSMISSGICIMLNQGWIMSNLIILILSHPSPHSLFTGLGEYSGLSAYSGWCGLAELFTALLTDTMPSLRLRTFSSSISLCWVFQPSVYISLKKALTPIFPV